LSHALHTDNTQRQTLTIAYEPVIHDRRSRQITFIVTHSVHIITINTSTNKCTSLHTIHDKYQTATCFGKDVQSVGKL